MAPAAISYLRKSWPAELVSLALQLIEARRKAADKFPDAARLVADAEGVEQATSLDVARHKAHRFAQAGVESVVDLGCGVGGDAMGLAEIGRVLLFDRDPVRAWMARHNTGCPAAIADVTTLRLKGRPFHVDPSRRSEGRRIWRYEDYEPSPAFIEQLSGGDGAVKLSPAIEFQRLPPGEVEVINRHGSLVQAVLWTGRLARHARTATRVDTTAPTGCSLPITSLHGTPDLPVPVAPPMRYLLAIDAAVERAGLTGELCRRLNLPAIHPALGLLTADRRVASDWLTPFELIETMPWRMEKIRQWLAAHGAGIVEVKTRGGAVDPDRIQHRLRGGGSGRFTVFVLRSDRRVVAYITRRPAHEDA